MTASDQSSIVKSRLGARVRFFLNATYPEADFILVYSCAAAGLFVLLRLQMLRRIVLFHIGSGWRYFHDQIANQDFRGAASVIFEYSRALWIIVRWDLICLGALTALCLLICTAARSVLLRKAVVALYCGIVLVGLLFLVANVQLAPLYSTQLNYSLLKFSGLLGGSSTTLLVMIPKSAIVAGLFVGGVLLAISFVSFLEFYQTRRVKIRRLYFAAVACGLLFIAAIPARLPIPGLTRVDGRITQNSLVYYLASIFDRSTLPDLAGGASAVPMDMSTSNDTIGLEKPQPSVSIAPVKNVIQIILESAGAEYFELLNNAGLLPTFSQMMSHGVYFNRAYASAPISNVSLVSILTSTAPLANYRLVTLDFPRAKIITSYEMLKAKGYHTGFFWSDDSKFLGIDNFLDGRGIDVNQDYRERDCSESRNLVTDSEAVQFMYSADTCTASSLLDWLDKDHGKPFFATLWTEQTHFTYAASRACMEAISARSDVVKPPKKQLAENWPRYAAALCDADRMMAKIIAGLRDRKLLDSTLVVVVGDHGEGFGQHDAFVHASEIYEDEIRVPLLISMGNALAGRVDDRLASHLDLLPTVASALGIPASDQWEGNDLLGDKGNRRVYFYTGWGNYKIGYREGNMKYVFDVLHQKLFTYDLASDPDENKDLTGDNPEADANARRLIDAWYLRRTHFATTLN
jgi:lipoteichoic acid synthase